MALFQILKIVVSCSKFIHLESLWISVFVGVVMSQFDPEYIWERHFYAIDMTESVNSVIGSTENSEQSSWLHRIVNCLYSSSRNEGKASLFI